MLRIHFHCSFLLRGVCTQHVTTFKSQLENLSVELGDEGEDFNSCSRFEVPVVFLLRGEEQ